MDTSTSVEVLAGTFNIPKGHPLLEYATYCTNITRHKLPGLGGKPGLVLNFGFPNGYGASLARNIGTYGNDKGLWELALLVIVKGRWEICYTRPDIMPGGIEGWLNPDSIAKWLKVIQGMRQPVARGRDLLTEEE